MKKDELIKYFYKEFSIDEIADYSLNGIQVDNNKDDIQKIAFAVDASLSSIQASVKEKADMLFVHHGFFWGKPLALVREHYSRVKALLDNNIMLFALHLPLDLHPLYGNNIQIAKTLGLVDIKPFGMYKGRKIGFKGRFSQPINTFECSQILGLKNEDDLKILNFGKEKCETVGIISGGAAEDVVQAIDEKIDLYITGEHAHTLYHVVKENKMNMIAGGHYKTEIFGVKAVQKRVEELGLSTCFIDIPTGM